MNKQELIKEYESIVKDDSLELCGCYNMADKNFMRKIYKSVLEDLRQLDEPQPIKLKDVIARIKVFDGGTQKVWLNEILNELGSDYGTLKYKAGYEQGKLEGEWVGQQLKDADKIRQELNKPVILQFVADWIKYCKNTGVTLVRALMVEEIDLYNYANQKDSEKLKAFLRVKKNQELFARAWLDGYTVKKEKRYIVKVKGISAVNGCLKCDVDNSRWFFSGPEESDRYRAKHTIKELDNAGFGWVFDCEGIEIEEVKDEP